MFLIRWQLYISYDRNSKDGIINHIKSWLMKSLMLFLFISPWINIRVYVLLVIWGGLFEESCFPSAALACFAAFFFWARSSPSSGLPAACPLGLENYKQKQNILQTKNQPMSRLWSNDCEISLYFSDFLIVLIAWSRLADIVHRSPTCSKRSRPW